MLTNIVGLLLINVPYTIQTTEPIELIMRNLIISLTAKDISIIAEAKYPIRSII